jgi:hypothetical protein
MPLYLVLQSWDILLPCFGGEKKHYQLFTIMLSCAVCAAGVLFFLILEFSERNMPHFLDDVHIVESLNEPVDDSCSEGTMGKCVLCRFLFL